MPSVGGAFNPNELYGMYGGGGIMPAINEYSADGIIQIQVGVAKITKGTAAALLLQAPARDGLILTISSTTAAAHVVTATTLLADAVSGSPHTTATFAAFKGATITLLALNGLWNVMGAVGVTIT